VTTHHEGTLHVIGAAYDELYEALDDYETIKDLYRDVRTSHDFDASVIAKDEDGTVRIVKKHEQPTRHGAVVGLGWGLAVGIASVLFPPIGIAAAGGAGAAIGAVAGHVQGGMSRRDLKDLGKTLDTGQAGLIVVFETTLADQVTANIKAANRFISKATKMAAHQLAADLRRAAAAREGDGQAVSRPPRSVDSPETADTATAT
jgi:uncharacterized membrane protein